MKRTHGYSLRGQRCRQIGDWLAKKKTNVIGALLGKRLIAVGLFECAINGDIFYEWVKQVLFKVLPKSSVVVMDNISFHKRPDIKKSMTDAGHQLEYLPVYSPELNPIEHKWAQAKQKRRAIDCDIDTLFSTYIT